MRNKREYDASVSECLEYLEDRGWTELIDSRFEDDVREEILKEFPRISDDVLEQVLKLVLV